MADSKEPLVAAALDGRILGIETELNQAFQQNALCQRIAEVEGIGPANSAALDSLSLTSQDAVLFTHDLSGLPF